MTDAMGKAITTAHQQVGNMKRATSVYYETPRRQYYVKKKKIKKKSKKKIKLQ